MFALLIIVGYLVKDLFSKPSSKEPFDQNLYEQKLKPINFPEKKFSIENQHRNDLAIKYAKLWKLPDLYRKSSEGCLKIYEEQHPNNLVKKNMVSELYGIKIGTNSWYDLTNAFERYATETCYSFSGNEIENVYADTLKKILSEKEILELLNFFETNSGKKYVATSISINEKIVELISQKQRIAYNKATDIYLGEINALQEKIHKK